MEAEERALAEAISNNQPNGVKGLLREIVSDKVPTTSRSCEDLGSLGFSYIRRVAMFQKILFNLVRTVGAPAHALSNNQQHFEIFFLIFLYNNECY